MKPYAVLLAVTTNGSYVSLHPAAFNFTNEEFGFGIDDEPVLISVFDGLDVFDTPLRIFGTPPDAIIRFARDYEIKHTASTNENMLNISQHN